MFSFSFVFLFLSLSAGGTGRKVIGEPRSDSHVVGDGLRVKAEKWSAAAMAFRVGKNMFFLTFLANYLISVSSSCKPVSMKEWFFR